MTPLERLIAVWSSAFTLGILACQTGAVVLCIVELIRGRPVSALCACAVAWLAERVEK